MRFTVSLAFCMLQAGATAWCGLDLFGICKAAERVADSVDQLPERIHDAVDEVLDHFFEHDFGKAVDKLTAAAKGVEERALLDYQKAINATRDQLEILAERVVHLVKDLAQDLTKNVEQIASAVEKDMVDGVQKVLASVDDEVSHLLDRIERDGEELICAAEGYINTMQKEYAAYFEKQDCECVRRMLELNPGLRQDCECSSCVHLGAFYPSCSCKPWGLRFAPGWFNRGKYEFLKCHLFKPIDWNHWAVGQIVAQLAIVQEAALSFRCLEDVMPGSTMNREYFSSEYLNITHTILVWSIVADPSDGQSHAVKSMLDDCAGKSIPECVTEAMAQLKQAEQTMREATQELEDTRAAFAKNYSTKDELVKMQQRIQGELSSLAASAPIGTILTMSFRAGGQAPLGLLHCDGSNVSRADYPELFKVIGTTWGQGDSVSTFGLPDLRGRALVGAGAGVQLTARDVGTLGGEEAHELKALELPSHVHSYSAAGGSADIRQYAAAATGHSNALARSSAAISGASGGNASHNNMQPYAVIAYFIKARSNSTDGRDALVII